MIKNLIFDVDGTLWDSTGTVAKAWSVACSEGLGRSVVLTPERLKGEFGKTMEEIGISLFPDEPKELRESAMAKAMEYEHDYVTRLGAIFYPGVLDTLKVLAQDYNLYIVSNAQSGYIELVMDKGGFADLIQDHLCYGDTGEGKGYNIAALMERNKLQKSETVYLGDIEGDNQASHAAGIKMIYCSYGFGQVDEPDYKIDCMADVVDLLKRIK